MKRLEGALWRDADPAEVLPGELFVGSSMGRPPPVSVGGIINCAAECTDPIVGGPSSSSSWADAPPILRLEWREVAGELLDNVEHRVLQFIAQHLPNGCIWIVCAAGQSRSVSIALMYLTTCRQITLCDAFGLIYRQRRCIQPNGDLWSQLCRRCNEPQLSLDDCRAAAHQRMAPRASDPLEVSSLQELEALCGRLPAKKGHHITLTNCLITADLADILCRPPRCISLIRISVTCICADEEIAKRLRKKLHISFIQPAQG